MRGQRVLFVVTQLLGSTSCYCRSSLAWAFLPGSTSLPRSSKWHGITSTSSSSVSSCVAYSSLVSVSEEVASSPSPSVPQKTDFFEQQLDVCKQIAIPPEEDQSNKFLERKIIRRTRFKEHPRCTARFGEVLLHARDGAYTSEEYQNAIHNARSIVDYVDLCRAQSKCDDDVCLVREGLIADIVQALTSRSIREFRVSQIEDVAEDVASKAKADFTLEQADLEILGRLYYSAISRNRHCLEEVGLTMDHAGFTALLALCRAASDSVSSQTNNFLSIDGAKLDAALSNHFNGITVPGCRFSFSMCHGIQRTKNDSIGRSKQLMVAFSSLGNGLVRHEFGGSLAKINNQLHSDGLDTFDVLFVADPSQSWYQKDSHGNFNGFAEYEQRILAASRKYEKVSLIGDSMGGSGALLFSHLATKSVVAFSPQINLDGDAHVSRYDMTTDIRDQYFKRLIESAEKAVAGGVKVHVHRGVEDADVRHTDQLMGHFPEEDLEGIDSSSSGHVKIVEHSDCEHHQVATHLKEKGRLSKVLSSSLIDQNE